jgi:dTDP-4-dehydrorhamnose 3,5-epimerase
MVRPNRPGLPETMLDILPTAIPDVKVLIPRRFDDARGHFSETWHRERMRAAGLDFDFVQDNHSFSALAGTVRGLHYQRPPHAQAKLVRVAVGRVRDVAVDVRRGSPSYGRWVAEELSAANGRQMLIPAGFLHGFAVLEDGTHVLYKADDHYAPECDGAVRFDDPALGIDWGIAPGAAILSDKDRAAPGFADFASPFVLGPA